MFFFFPGLSVSDTQLHLKGRCNERDHCLDRNLAMLQRHILKILDLNLRGVNADLSLQRTDQDCEFRVDDGIIIK